MIDPTRWTLKPRVLPSATPELPDAVVTIAYGPVPSLPVEVVPVPDEQAIERAARALANRRRPLGHGLDAVLAARIARQAREDVLLVLVAALEQPDLRPSTGSQETHASLPQKP